MKLYFPHDENARHDEKISHLLRVHGWEGYGLFWAIVEKIFENNGSISADFETLAHDLRVDSKIVKSISSSFNLFYVDKERLRSHSLDRRINDREKRMEKARRAGKIGANARWGNKKPVATLKQPHSNRIATESEPYSIEREITSLPAKPSVAVPSNGFPNHGPATTAVQSRRTGGPVPPVGKKA